MDDRADMKHGGVKEGSGANTLTTSQEDAREAQGIPIRR